MIHIRWMAPLILNIALGGCQNQESYVWHDGQINNESVSMAIERMEKIKDLDAFYISSGGGDSAAGMRLGRYLQKREIPVVVVGRCFSACANYVLLPAMQRRAAPWAKIGMHGGYRSYQSRLIESATKFPPHLKEAYRSSIANGEITSDAETKLLRAAGVNPEIIEKSAEETYYGAYQFQINRPGAVESFAIEKKKNTDFELWFPKSEDYRTWGISIKTVDPSSLPSEIFNRFSTFKDDTPISNEP